MGLSMDKEKRRRKRFSWLGTLGSKS